MTADIGRTPADYIEEKVKGGIISREDGAIVLRYIEQQTAEQGFKLHTAASNCRYTVKIVQHVPDISAWSYPKILKYVTMVRKTYKPNTVRKDLFTVKNFTGWLLKEKVITGITKEQLAGIKPPAADRMTKVAEDMLTDSEFQQMLTSTKTSRDRAIISVLFESALRPFELLSLAWGDIKFDDKGAVVNTAGKTGAPRYIRLIQSAPHLLAWKNDYPVTIRNDSPVFVNLNTNDHHEMTRGALKKILKKASACLGNEKRVHAYLFRHSRISEMVAKGIPDSVVKLQCWGSLSTPMLATYAHISNEQQDVHLLAAAGKVNKTVKSESAIREQVCPSCAKVNPGGMEFCGKCGAILDPEKYQQSITADASEVAALKAKISEMEATLDQVTLLEGTMAAFGEQVAAITAFIAAHPDMKIPGVRQGKAKPANS